MLTSLFGELGLTRRAGGAAAAEDFAPTQAERPESPERLSSRPAEPPPFTASAVLESTDTRVDAQGRLVDRHVKDLFITGSPAAAMRQHFANRYDPQTAGHAITLHDPTGVWAPAVIKALADASGQPVERLHLRHQATLGTLAMIERTRLHRPDETLKIYHPDVRAVDAASGEIPIVLMERAQLAVLMIGTLAPELIDDWLDRLQRAVRAPSWHCPALLFMLPPSAVWIAGRLQTLHWPAGLRITVLQDPLTSASAVWNALLDVWNQTRHLPRWQAQRGGAEPALQSGASRPGSPGSGPSPTSPGSTFTGSAPASAAGSMAMPWPATPARAAAQAAVTGEGGGTTAAANDEPGPGDGAGTATEAATDAATAAATTAAAAPTTVLDAARAVATLHALARSDGLLGCAIVDEQCSTVVARSTDGVDLEMAAAASVQLWRAHRVAARLTEGAGHVDEIVQGTGARHLVLRRLSHHPGRFMMAVLDRHRANLALVRFRMQEADRHLA